jgi:2-(1,2-epoxy-1,2-dihydrophenyl)acetyl-CoA isomerase
MPGPPTLESVALERRGTELRIVLHRPETMNAWNRELGVELLAAVEHAASEDAVRVVVITGAGRAFSSGADLKAGFERTPEGRLDIGGVLRRRYHPIIAGIRRMPKPVVAAINGPAVGIGCSLALACDLLVARESAYLMLAFVHIGLVPDGGSSLFAPARVGAARAAEMAMLGERVPARQALEWGLVNRVVPDDAFDSELDALAGRLAAGPTRAYAGAKRALNGALYPGLEDQLELEASIQEELAGSADVAEGLRAFADKRPPSFGGG